MAPFDPTIDPSTLTNRELALVARGVSGGDENDPPEATPAADPPAVPEVPESLADLDEAAIRALHGELGTAYDARRANARSQADTDALAAIRESQARLAGELRERTATAERLEGLDSTDVSLPDAAPDSPQALENAGDPPADPTQTPPAGDGGDATTPAATAPATAAADTLQPGDFASDPNAPAPPPARTRPRSALVAAIGPHSVEVGADLGGDLGALGRAITESFSALRPGRDGSAMKARVATISAYEDMGDGLGVELLGSGNAAHNTGLIREAVDSYMAALPEPYGTPNAQVAAICDPLDIIRQIPDCVTDAEPFADTLPGRPAGRLGFQFMPSAALSEVTAGVTIWDEADQAAVSATDQGTWKPCVLVTCPPISEVIAEAVTACIVFDNTTEMSSPERVQDFMRKIAAAKARAKEDRLLQIASTFTHRYRHVGEYGAVPASITALLTVLQQGWATNRLEESTLYNWYVPAELLSAWVIDLVGRAFDAQDISDVVAYIEERARAAGRNVRIVRLLDRSITPTLPLIGGVAEEYLESGIKSGAYETYLIPPEGAIYFSTGEINVGVERSPELMRQNRAQWFMEEYVGLAKHGCQPWYRLQLDVCENGTRAALTTPFTCEDAS